MFQKQVGKSTHENIIVEPCLHLEDLHYCSRMRQRYWSIEVLWTVVTVVDGEVAVENLNAPSNSIVWICIALLSIFGYLCGPVQTAAIVSALCIVDPLLFVVDSVLFVPWSQGSTRQ